jgi:hypothetical protein
VATRVNDILSDDRYPLLCCLLTAQRPRENLWPSKCTVRFIDKSFYAVVMFRLPAYSRSILTILLKFFSFKDTAPGPWEGFDKYRYETTGPLLDIVSIGSAALVAPTTRRLSEIRGSASAFYRPAQAPQQVVMLYQVPSVSPVTSPVKARHP